MVELARGIPGTIQRPELTPYILEERQGERAGADLARSGPDAASILVIRAASVGPAESNGMLYGFADAIAASEHPSDLKARRLLFANTVRDMRDIVRNIAPRI